MERISKANEIHQVILNTKGKFFTTTFIKKDGSVRTMTARTGVHKGVNGKGLKFNPTDKDLVVVYEMNKDGHRMINLNTVTQITFNNQTLNF